MGKINRNNIPKELSPEVYGYFKNKIQNGLLDEYANKDAIEFFKNELTMIKIENSDMQDPCVYDMIAKFCQLMSDADWRRFQDCVNKRNSRKTCRTKKLFAITVSQEQYNLVEHIKREISLNGNTKASQADALNELLKNAGYSVKKTMNCQHIDFNGDMKLPGGCRPKRDSRYQEQTDMPV